MSDDPKLKADPPTERLIATLRPDEMSRAQKVAALITFIVHMWDERDEAAEDVLVAARTLVALASPEVRDRILTDGLDKAAADRMAAIVVEMEQELRAHGITPVVDTLDSLNEDQLTQLRATLASGKSPVPQ